MKPEKEGAQRCDPLSPGNEKHCTDLDSKPESEAQDPDDFDWADDPAIVLKRQPAVAVYVNRRDEVVIRQEADIGYDEDEFIFVGPDNAETLARAIVSAAKPKQRRLRLVDGGE